MRKILITGSIILSSIALFAQDIHFSQINEMPLLTNAALCGTTYSFRGILNYREQWRSVTIPYKTFDVSIDAAIAKKKTKPSYFGAGLLAYYDKAGTSEMGTVQVNLYLSGILKVDDKNILSAGISGGYAQQSYTTDQLRWGNQYNGYSYDPGIPSVEHFDTPKFSFADFNAGLLWSYDTRERYMTAGDEKKFNFGVSASHINQPKLRYFSAGESLAMKFTVHGGAAIGISNTNYAIAPSFLYLRQGKLKEITAGTFVKYQLRENSRYTGFIHSSYFSLGGFYRASDAMILALLFEKENYSVGFSYDVNSSKLREASNAQGAFEISIRYITFDRAIQEK